MKRHITFSFCVFALLFSALVLSSSPAHGATKYPVVLEEAPKDLADLPNIVLVMADDQGWGDMAYLGHPKLKTPNFDAMAKEGLRLDRFYAAAPVCSPTRGSVMTGRHPNRYGIWKWGYPLRPQEVTIGEVLQKVGYKTGHFGKWHIGSVRKGSPVNPGASGFDVWLSAENFYDNDAILSKEGTAVQCEGESSEIAVDAAIEFIDDCVSAKKKQPFLAVVWFGSPHSPHRASEKFLKMYEGEKNANFLGEITGMDFAFGKLRDKIAKLGLKENTILWYTSDNGALPCGSTGGRRGNKGSIYEGGLAVPAIVEWPAVIKKPRTSLLRCNTADIYPTILKNQPHLDGISLKNLFFDAGKDAQKQPPREMGFWDANFGGKSTPSAAMMTALLKAQSEGKELDDPAALRLDADKVEGGSTIDSLGGRAAYIEGDWKIIKGGGGGKKKGKGKKPAPSQKQATGNYELYNLADDYAETKNVAANNPDVVKRLKKKLEKWQQSVVDSYNGKDY